MHGSSHELGLLELQRFLIKEPRPVWNRVNCYAIFDPGTQEQVGSVRAEPARLVSFLRWLWPRALGGGRLEVCETEDESLVFIVRHLVGLRGQRIEIYDADDHLIGCGKNSSFSGGRSFQLYDRNGLAFAKVEGECPGPKVRFLSRDGRELGVLARDTAVSSNEGGAETGYCLVSIHEELAELPLVKMVLLGTALALDRMHHAQGR